MELTDHEYTEILRVNESGLTPVVFVHGLGLLPSSWDRWRELFQESGFATIAPGWPGDPETVEQARKNPKGFAGTSIDDVSDRYHKVVDLLTLKPAIVGHSFGGLIAQRLAGDGVSRATVAIDPAPFRGVLPLPRSSLKSASAVLSNPANYTRAVTLTFDQFLFGWANAIPREEAKRLYDTYHVAAPGRPLFSAATANINPFTQARVDTKNPARGPLLIVSGTTDNTVPSAITSAMFGVQRKNRGTTELAEIENRGHSLVIDDGWKDVAGTSLRFIQRFVPGE